MFKFQYSIIILGNKNSYILKPSINENDIKMINKDKINKYEDYQGKLHERTEN